MIAALVIAILALFGAVSALHQINRHKMWHLDQIVAKYSPEKHKAEQS